MLLLSELGTLAVWTFLPSEESEGSKIHANEDVAMFRKSDERSRERDDLMGGKTSRVRRICLSIDTDLPPYSSVAKLKSPEALGVARRVRGKEKESGSGGLR